MKKLYLAFVTVLLHLITFSQTQFNIGTGTTGNSNSEFPTALQDYYEGSRAQYLYRASELQAAGMTFGAITGIKFRVMSLNSFTGTIEQMRIRIGTGTSLSSTAWEGALTDVYGPYDFAVQPDTNIFHFFKPFYWNGFDNIVVEICNGDTANAQVGVTTYSRNPTIPWTTGLSFNGSHTYAQDDGGNLCGTDSTTNIGAQTTRPNITFTWECNYNLLNLSAFVDRDGSAIKDSTEPYNSNQKFLVAYPDSSGVDTMNVYTSDVASLRLDTGTNYMEPTILRNYHVSVPLNYTTAHTTYHNSDTALFALQHIATARDLAARVFPGNVPRAGFSYVQKIYYKNVGTDTARNVVIDFSHSNNVTFDSASFTPYVLSGDSVHWYIDSLLPGEYGTIDVYGTVSPTAQLGDIIISRVHISSDKTDNFPRDNGSVYCFRVRCCNYTAVKTEASAGTGAPPGPGNVVTLTYTINFQNTYADTILNLSVSDTFSNLLDWKTLEMVAASHRYQMVLKNGIAVWKLDHINLVDSTTNEPLSHGHIVFTVKSKPAINFTDTIENTAVLAFDGNPPVKTETDKALVAGGVLPLKLLAFTASKDGKVNNLQWSTVNEINVDHFDVERSNNGREYVKIGVAKAGLNKYSFIDSKPLAALNYYRLNMIDKDGNFTYSPVRMISNNSGFLVSIYPNPAKDNLQVQVESDKKATLQMLVLSTDGKVMLSKNITANEGNTLQSINISTLPKGCYLMKINGSNEEQVVKFEKL